MKTSEKSDNLGDWSMLILYVNSEVAKAFAMNFL